ncbi:hypothetical protein NXX77_27300 [Phocaeicola dorei]|nr:hypothetical protein [Phocaeicola dorei]
MRHTLCGTELPYDKRPRPSCHCLGFSRGGGQSMFTALKHSDRIGWMGSYSAYLTPQVMEKYFPNLKEKANSLNMLWFCVGKDDILYKEVISNTKYFNEKGIHYEIDDREGAHTWMHARYCLAETYKKLFKDKKESEKYPGIMIDASTLPGFSVFYPTNLKEMVAKQGRFLGIHSWQWCLYALFRRLSTDVCRDGEERLCGYLGRCGRRRYHSQRYG